MRPRGLRLLHGAHRRGAGAVLHHACRGCEGKQIETSEGIAADERWRPLVEAYAKHDAAQCGYCTPGQFTVAKYIIEKYGNPTDEQIRAELAGNICRCGTYSRHVQAIQEAAGAIKGGN